MMHGILDKSKINSYKSYESFQEKLTRCMQRKNSLLCVGIDPMIFKDLQSSGISSHNDDIHIKKLEDYCHHIIDETIEYACAYKINIAFFEALGFRGIKVLEEICGNILAYDTVVILDVKRGDIPSTAEAYAFAYFERMNVDAITVNPYMGMDTILPYLKFKSKGIFVLCKTSNDKSYQIQDMEVINPDSLPLSSKNITGNRSMVHLEVAKLCLELDLTRESRDHKGEDQSHIGFVLGAICTESIKKVRGLSQKSIFLIPGVGFQDGNLRDSLRFGLNDRGEGVLITISRSIGNSNNVRMTAGEYWREINKMRDEVLSARQKS